MGQYATQLAPSCSITSPGNDVLHALANDNQLGVVDRGRGYSVAYVIVHDPVRLRGCEQVIRLSPAEAAANDDNG